MTDFLDDLGEQLSKDAIKMTNMLYIEDDIGVVLRTTFYFEDMLKNWVSHKLGVDIFRNSKIDNEYKLDIANNIGLESEFFNTFEKVFNIRNKLAHNHTAGQIIDSQIQSMEAKLKTLSGKKKIGFNADNYGAKIYNEDGSLKTKLIYKECGNKNKYSILLVQIYALMYTRLLVDEYHNR